jgi:site-specific DNA-methyltransferase (adenine-specific)
LSCIANLSNDEVFTPPELANRMLDTLAEAWAQSYGGASIWADPDIRFLDPCTKSGIFLREITSRLNKGLAEQMPDVQQRVEHILTKQVFGIAITNITSLLARRSIYCSKFAKGKHSVVQCFKSDAGNIWFERTEHTWVHGKCEYCGAGRSTLDRGDEFESHAYAFIHCADIKARMAELFGENMQFDVIIGNPPYQLDDGGHGASAAPIYHLFVEKALALDPQFAVFVTPSRWMAGGKGLDKFRQGMLSDRRLREIVDFPKLYEAFPGVKIRGGISYFVWQRDLHGPCRFQTIWDGQPTGPVVERYLDTYDVLVRQNAAIPILEKVRAKGEAVLSSRVSSRKPFGLPTNFRGKSDPSGLKEPIRLFENQRTGWMERRAISVGSDLLDRYKVLMTRVQGTSGAVETKFLSKPIVAPPGTACTETYLVAGHFETAREAENFAAYLRTRFVRFLVSLRKPTQDAARGVYGFVPDLAPESCWTDERLYSRYQLTAAEVEFIESQVASQSQDVDDAQDECDDE